MSRFNPAQPLTALKFDAGSRESTVITMPAVGDATQGDYIMMYNAAGTSLAAFIDIDSDGTSPTGALYVASDSQATLAYKNAVNETYVVTIPATASATQADYFMIYDEAGNSTAVFLDIDAAGTVPTGALYVASDNQITGGIATGDTSAQAATKVYTALNGNVTNVSFTDNLDGTITIALDNTGPATAAAVPKSADDSTAGSITIGTITSGVLATTAIAGGALLAATSLTDVTFTDNGDATVTMGVDNIGNATDPVPKDADDSGVGSITVSATDGSSAAGYEGYPSPGSSPADLLINPATIS